MTERLHIVDRPAALAKAKSYIDRKMPNVAYRTSVLNVISRSIHLINSINPKCWSINFSRNGPFLLVEHEWALYTTGSSTLGFHVFLNKINPSARAQLDLQAKVTEDKKDLWSTIELKLPDQEHLINDLWPGFEAYLEQKARFNLHPSSIPPHIKNGAGLVEYIRDTGIDPDLPQPAYISMETAAQNTIHREDESLSLSILVEAFATGGLSFTPWQIATFFTALQTKGFVVLSGISGMGKTKLAQAFARLLPQPNSRIVLPADLIRIIVQPYMLKYNRFIIPKAGSAFFNPPDPGQSVQIRITFPTGIETCTFNHYQGGGADYIQVLLRGAARQWFAGHFVQGDKLILEPKTDENGNLSEFRLGKPEDFVHSVEIKTEENPENYLFLSVRPDWRDSKSLLGYYNPIDQQYHATPFLEFIRQACESHQRNEKLAWFVLLDEMNLARVEYYFSDLLSVLESGRDQDGWSRESIRLDYPMSIEMSDFEREIRLPPNLYIIGTVNVDETTHAFSPKVLDRAFTLELSEADFSNYPGQQNVGTSQLSQNQCEALLDCFTRQGRFARIDKVEIIHYLEGDTDLRQRLSELNHRLQPYDLHFGYRVLDEIAAFLANAEQNGFYEDLNAEDDPLDAAILMKVLPKFHGSRSKLEDPLKEVLAWCIDPLSPHIDQVDLITQNGAATVKSVIRELENLPYQYPYTAGRVIRMIRSLYTTGFASFS